MNVLCNGHVPRAVGRGSNDTPFLGKYYFFPLAWVYDPPPLFNPTIETTSPPLFKSLPTALGAPPPTPLFFLKILKVRSFNLGALLLNLVPQAHGPDLCIPGTTRLFQ